MHLTRKAFIEQVNSALAKSGGPSILGHSFRWWNYSAPAQWGSEAESQDGRTLEVGFPSLNYWCGIFRRTLLATAPSAALPLVHQPTVSVLGTCGCGHGRRGC